MNNSERIEKRTGSLIAGLVLITLGTLFLLDRADVLDFSDVIRHYWPLFVIGAGVTRLLSGEIWNGLWMLAAGSWMQLVTLGMFGLTWGSSWPILLIVLGAGMIVRALFAAAGRDARSSEEGRRHES